MGRVTTVTSLEAGASRVIDFRSATRQEYTRGRAGGRRIVRCCSPCTSSSPACSEVSVCSAWPSPPVESCGACSCCGHHAGSICHPAPPDGVWRSSRWGPHPGAQPGRRAAAGAPRPVGHARAERAGGAGRHDSLRRGHRAHRARVGPRRHGVVAARPASRGSRARSSSGLLAGLIATSGAWLTHAAGRIEHGGSLMLLTVAHQLGAAVWVGGLVQLGALWRLGRHDPGAAAAWPVLVRRFSTLAAVAVGALVLSALPLTWAYTGSWPALVGTGYGSLVLTKAALLLAVLAIAFVTRRGVHASGRRRGRLPSCAGVFHGSPRRRRSSSSSSSSPRRASRPNPPRWTSARRTPPASPRWSRCSGRRSPRYTCPRPRLCGRAAPRSRRARRARARRISGRT